MKLRILTGEWTVEQSDDEIYAETEFPNRVIRYNLSSIDNEQMFKHCMLHEITHAYQAELGQWQNVLGNGRSEDEFDCEWIAEFIAIYASSIIETYELIKHLYESETEIKFFGEVSGRRTSEEC